jgi:hypothetical protein
MKKAFILSAFVLFTAVALFAQTVPSGMKYQAVARDANGDILSLAKIGLEIKLLKNGPGGEVVFSEVYQVTTNVLGLFSITIGEGESKTGILEDVPWSSSEIWMNIGVDERGGTHYTTITTTKLLTVPYAFHAGTAANIVPGPELELQEKFPDPYCAPNTCPCEGGFTELKVFYFGEDGVNIEVFGNSSLTISIASFTGINKGDLLTIDGTTTALGILYSKTYFRVTNGAGESCIARIPSRCATNSFPGATEDNEVIGKSFGDFIVYSRVDEGYNSDCTVGDKGQAWFVGGNIVDAANTSIGTRNNENLTILTNDIVRGVFTNDGDLSILNNVNLNTASGETKNNGDFTVTNMKSTLLSGKLTVDLATDLNAALNVDGPSNLQSSLSVNNNSSTTLSGTLLVQDNSIFNEHVTLDNINLNSNSISSGALVVSGGVGIGRNLNVGGESAFGGPVNFAGAVSITDETESVSTGSGALIVTGGLGIGKRLNVGGTAEVGDETESTNSGSGALRVKGGAGITKKLNVGGTAAIEDGTESSDSNSGALKVAGGVGIKKQLNVAGITKIENGSQSSNSNSGALKVEGGVGIKKQLNVAGITKIENGTESSNSNTGALKVTGGVGIKKKLNVAGNTKVESGTSSTSTASGALVVTGGVGIGEKLNVGNTVNINAVSSGNTALIVKGDIPYVTGAGTDPNNNPKESPQHHIAQFENTDNGNGISIKINAGTPHNVNNFITFYNASGNTVGRIEGENGSADYSRNREYQDAILFKALQIILTTTESTIAGLEVLSAGGGLVAASTSSTACVGFGACVTTPIPSLIISATAKTVLKAANLATLVLDVALVDADGIAFENTHHALRGITFASGSEDYAEYLPKHNPRDIFNPGDIVGVSNGYITKVTRNAELIMVISHKPIIAGGLPADEDASNFELVAFMGQVPARVSGTVKIGDYILPSGYNNGFGIGKSPERMRPDDYKKVLGIAWEENKDMSIGFVNTAIGLNTNDMADLVQEQSDKIKAQAMKIKQLETQVAQTNSILADLVPGFAEAAGMNSSDNDHDGHGHEFKETFSEASHLEEAFIQSTTDQVVYFPVKREYLEEGFKLAEAQTKKVFAEMGVDMDTHPFWGRIYNEEGFKEEVLDGIAEDLKQAMHTHNEINGRVIGKE